MDEISFRAVIGLFLLLAFPVSAGIVLTGTRVIYPASKPEVTIALKNTGQQPALVQSWIDNGDPAELPEKIHVPFVLTPPINRIDAGKSLALRLRYIGGKLPGDRESIFWLNVLAVPPKHNLAERQQAEYLHVAFQTRIKLFYRPDGLSEDAETAAGKIQWKKGVEGLTAYNPTPYFISLASVEWQADGNNPSLSGKMVAPFGHLRIAQEKNALQNARNIRWLAINDTGNVTEFTALLTE